MTHKCVALPRSLRVDPKSIKTKQEASSFFWALANFYAIGNSLDEAGTERFCSFLEIIKPRFKSLFTSEQILTELVPLRDRSCQGFAECLVPLLICPNQQIVFSTLDFFQETIYTSSPQLHYAFVRTGFFTLLPPAFYEQAHHVLPRPVLLFADILNRCLDFVSPFEIDEISQACGVTQYAIRHDAFINVVQPLAPLLKSFSRNKLQFVDNNSSRHLPSLLNTLIQLSPFHSPTANFVLSSPICFLITSSLVFFESNKLQSEFLTAITNSVSEWPRLKPNQRQSSKGLLSQLKAEGLFDILSLYPIHTTSSQDVQDSVLFSAKLIGLLGGNSALIANQNEVANAQAWHFPPFEEEWWMIP
ncbi:hypothetical protein BLNAU_19384 [Blattamonas nauphoetae]|uniref:Uncharacterized protein n=1 Tax=Blattamonas nauphoetae TaxID=2049346 RepID=A0ABQ9X2X9_9EUKA|nr:hypothetical protein BLNAU_19384 [Blattamonas nauphoetae]